MNIIAKVDRASVQERVFEQARKILKCDRIRPEDYFLDLGGDSLMAPILARRIAAEFGFRPELEDIFTRPLGDLAELVASASEMDR